MSIITKKVFEGQWYWVEQGYKATIGACDFTECIYLFGVLIKSTVHKEVTLSKAKLMFAHEDVYDINGNKSTNFAV